MVGVIKIIMCIASYVSVARDLGALPSKFHSLQALMLNMN